MMASNNTEWEWGKQGKEKQKKSAVLWWVSIIIMKPLVLSLTEQSVITGKN